MIIPGILEKDFEEIEKKLAIVKPFSRWVHIDFVDGKFSEEKSFLDIEKFQKYKEDFFMEAHLMVEEPLSYVKPLAEVGFRRFLGHLEKMKNTDEFIAQSQLLGEVGLALDTDTGIDKINVSFEDLDMILLMSVKAGKSGQEFDPKVLEKISKLKELTFVPIVVDGGIDEKNFKDVLKAGADNLITTSHLFGSENPQKFYETLSLSSY